MDDLDWKCPHCKGWVEGGLLAQEQHKQQCVELMSTVSAPNKQQCVELMSTVSAPNKRALMRGLRNWRRLYANIGNPSMKEILQQRTQCYTQFSTRGMMMDKNGWPIAPIPDKPWWSVYQPENGDG